MPRVPAARIIPSGARSSSIAKCSRARPEGTAPQRLRKLTHRAFVSPLLSSLRDAGASQKEATCIVNKIEAIEIFFPSEDFNGLDSAEMAGDRFVENAPGCARADRLRNIVRTLFKQYVDGSTKSTDDPMAPYDC